MTYAAVYRRRIAGFTIIELLVVIAIASILVTLALPSYREYVQRTRRTVAKTAVQDILTRQESYAVDHKNYAADFGRLGLVGTGNTNVDVAYVTGDGNVTLTSANALYSLTLSQIARATTTAMAADCSSLGTAKPGTTDTAFAVSAVPVASNGDARCGTLCASSKGERGASGSGGVADCWQR